MPAPDVTVAILTQRRPGPLALAAGSILKQSGLGDLAVEFIVVDNDQAPSAQALVESLAQNAPFPTRYVHEPRPGVATARNAAVKAAAAPLIAFLDDDEEAPPGWLAALVAAHKSYGADVVFGPVRGRAPERVGWRRPYLEWFFSRVDPAAAGVIDHFYGCGCSLIARAALPHPEHPFEERANETGGEDDVLFRAMQVAGATFAWAPDAWVWEDPAPDRVSLAYALRRAFVYGQGPPHHCWNAGDRAGAVGWMFVGAAQTGIFGSVAAAKWLLRRPDRAFAVDRALRGLGKVLWWGPFKLKLYGRTAATPPGS
ncbi:MAG TPA: glycosyltransferase [Caulobacteraceae bacterium]|jgi:glycosyltransferase involved in cell wall biosynthesis